MNYVSCFGRKGDEYDTRFVFFKKFLHFEREKIMTRNDFCLYKKFNNKECWSHLDARLFGKKD